MCFGVRASQFFKQLLGKQGLEFFGRGSLRIASIAGQGPGVPGGLFCKTEVSNISVTTWDGLGGFIKEKPEKIDSKLYLNL